MNNIQTSELLEQLDTYRTNPNAIQRSVYGLLTKASAGKLNVIDPTNPFSLLLEASAVVSADGLAECESLTRRQYPKLTTNEEDLYGHIADAEYVGIYGTPSSDEFLVIMNLAEIKARARGVPGQTFSKITIPRETKVTIGGVEFGFCYPIDLRVSNTGTLSIFYDTTIESPFMALDSNIIEYDVVRMQNREYVRFRVRGLQYKLDTYNTSVSSSLGFTTSLRVEDQLYYCRVYQKNAQGEFEELSTTHSGRVYDPKKATATLKYADGLLTVKIPEIYFRKGMIAGSIRIDVFTTKGDINMALSDYTANAIQIKWDDYTPVDGGRYSSVLSEMNELTIVAGGTTVGGGDGLTFDQKRERVVNNSTHKPVPVTNLDLHNDLTDSGYNVVTVIDNITDRQYMATRPLPVPTKALASSAMGSLVDTLLVDPTLTRTISTVRTSNRIVSIMPDTLYKRNGTSFTFVPDMEREALDGYNTEALINAMGQTEYFYTPYLTVLNEQGSKFEYNTYQIDYPTVKNKFFQAENAKVDYEASVASLNLTREDSGYHLEVRVKGEGGHESLAFDKMGLQLAFTPEGSLQRVYLNGESYGRDENGLMVYRFHLKTDFEVRTGHSLMMTNFEMINGDTLDYPVKPDTKYDFIHYVTNVGLTDENRDELHSLIGNFNAPIDAVVIAHETANLEVFQTLDGLVSRSRSSVGEPVYERWEVDVPWLYEKDEYETGADGFMVLYPNADNTGYEGKLEHPKGSPVLDANGQARFKYRKGDFKLDHTGNKIPVGSGDVLRYVDLLLFDARYRYTTEQTSVSYRDQVHHTIVEWIHDDIVSLQKVLLPRTQILFAPTSTMGGVTIYSTAGEPLHVDAGMSISIDLYMSENGYANSALRASITEDIRGIVVAELAKTQVSTGAIHEAIRAVAGDDVISIKVHSFNGMNLDAFTVDNESATCSLAKTFEQQPDGTIALVDDLSINFVKHG